ncbi:AMP-binding protein [Streptosporangium lutulentum]
MTTGPPLRYFQVVVNVRGQYGIWPLDDAMPGGWSQIGFVSTRDECLVHVAELWWDMRPRGKPDLADDEPDGWRSRITEVAAARPDAVALSDASRHLTYGELVEDARRLAGRLAALGVRTEDRVALCLPLGAPALTAILGVALTGAAYLPIDSADDEDWRDLVIADSGVRVVVTDRPETLAHIGADLVTWPDPEGRGTPVRRPRVRGALVRRGLRALPSRRPRVTGRRAGEPAAGRPAGGRATDPRGRPRLGVGTPVLRACQRRRPLHAERRGRGGPVARRPHGPARTVAALLVLLRVSGDRRRVRRVHRAQRRDRPGAGADRPAVPRMPPVRPGRGHPAALRGRRRALYVGGRVVARGYLDDPAATVNRFVPDPFAADGSRMFATEHRVRLNDDGVLERLDDGPVRTPGG